MREENAERIGREQIAKQLGIPADWLLQVFKIESSNNPAAVNPYTNAAGLIQFMPSTLLPWRLTPQEVARMTYNNQLNLVVKYLSPYKTRIKSVTDLYLSIFYPYAMAMPDSYILGSERGIQSAIFKQNPGFRNKTNEARGYYTKADIVQYVTGRAPVQKTYKVGVPEKQGFFAKLILLISKLFDR